MFASATAGFLRELLVDALERRLERPLVEPVDQAQREEVLAAVASFAPSPVSLAAAAVQLVDRHLDQAVALERAVFERVVCVAGLLQVAGAEGVVVDDEDAAVFHRS